MSAGSSVARQEGPAARALHSAVALGTPEGVADDALAVTRRKFGRAWSERSEAYFWGIVRRRALRGQAPRVSRRLVLDSFARELADAGHSPQSVFAEIVRVFGADEDRTLIDRYRPLPERAA
jgi:hypothetical protein